MHLLAALLAIMLVGLFSMHMTRSTHEVQTNMWQNEVLTQVSGIGLNVLEHVGRRPFDENTDESKKYPLVYPVITGTASLTAENDATGWGTCTSLAYTSPTCDDLDDFDGLTVADTAGGLPYTVVVNVQYVDPANPSASTGGTKSFAKEVALVITTPLLQVGGQPVAMTMSRVFTYNRHTTAP